MPAPPVHRIVAADAHCVPRPFRSFAVRSDEPRHAHVARAPYGRVHLVQTRFWNAAALARLAATGRARVDVDVFPEIGHAATTLDELTALAPGVADLAGALAGALQLSGVMGNDPGDDPRPYRDALATRIDFLACSGAGFHNDVGRHWSRCLFWLLALHTGEVEFVMPHAGVRLALAPGDLLVFDPAMAHGLCRPQDQGQAVAAHFAAGAQGRQVFLTGELPLSDDQWAALGAPWLPVELHQDRGALDLLVAAFDERSGAIQQLHALRGGMRRSTCHVDTAPG